MAVGFPLSRQAPQPEQTTQPPAASNTRRQQPVKTDRRHYRVFQSAPELICDLLPGSARTNHSAATRQRGGAYTLTISTELLEAGATKPSRAGHRGGAGSRLGSRPARPHGWSQQPHIQADPVRRPKSRCPLVQSPRRRCDSSKETSRLLFNAAQGAGRQFITGLSRHRTPAGPNQMLELAPPAA